MPLFSAFTPFGLLDFSSQDSDAEKAYRALKANYGTEAFDYTIGTEHEADVYATAMAIGAARSVLRRAANQHNPATSFESLPAHEQSFGIVPPKGATLADRQALAGERNQVLRGSRPEAILAALSGILGDDLLAIRTITSAEAEQWPTAPSADGPGHYSDPKSPPKFIRMLGPVAGALDGVTPWAFTVPYENWDPNDATVTLQVGERLCIQPEVPDVSEVVTISVVDSTSTPKTFTAEFLYAHDDQCAATTRTTPIWTSSKRCYLIIVKATASVDPEKRRAVNEQMQRMVRGVSTWSIVQATDEGARTVGPFELDVNGLGTMIIGTLTY